MIYVLFGIFALKSSFQNNNVFQETDFHLYNTLIQEYANNENFSYSSYLSYEGNSENKRLFRNLSNVKNISKENKTAEVLVAVPDDPQSLDKEIHNTAVSKTLAFENERLERKEFIYCKKFYKGKFGNQRLLREEYYYCENCEADFYKSDAKEKRLEVRFYKGSCGKERLVRIEYSDNEGTWYYKGDAGNERLVQVDYSDDEKWYYEGDAGKERLVRVKYSEKWYDEKNYGNKTLVQKESSNGDKWFYEGKLGDERLVRKEFSNGDKWFYEGNWGNERLVRKEFSNGDKWFYEGNLGNERLVEIELSFGINAGEKERLVRVEYYDYLKPFYKKYLLNNYIQSYMKNCVSFFDIFKFTVFLFIPSVLAGFCLSKKKKTPMVIEVEPLKVENSYIVNV